MVVEKPQQIPFDLGHRSAYRRDDFLIGSSNHAAVGWIDRWSADGKGWGAPALIISGPAASGKTHLAGVWQELSGAQFIDPARLLNDSAEDIAASAANTGGNIIFDGVDPWIGDKDAETKLFHIYNMFKEDVGRSFLMTMRMAPGLSEFALNDLASRLRAAPMAQIHGPDDVLLASVLIKQFSDRQLKVSNDVVKYILPRMERSFSAARDIVRDADRLALSRKTGISIPLMRDVLAAH